MNPEMEKDYKEKTGKILTLLERRTCLPPWGMPVDPRLQDVERIPWNTPFSHFNQEHLQVASRLFTILHSAERFDDFLNLAENVRTIDNDDLFLYVLYACVIHRADCRGVTLPPIEEAAPHWFFAAETIHEAIQLTIHRPNEDHVVINQRTAEPLEPESRLAYFREDVSLNTHHWAWHVVFPSVWDANATGIVKDRKGELFYYMHQQMVARYICERMSNGMSRVLPLNNFREKLGGYAPHLTSETTGVHFGTRPEGLQLRDLPTSRVQDMELWRVRIYDAIDQRGVRAANGSNVTLDNERGIDILGAIVEASSDSVNSALYGNLHNTGHNMLAQIHDPDSRFRQFPGVMAFTETAPRDPIFYRWHKFIDDLFHRHKILLTPYSRDELSLADVMVVSAKVVDDEPNVLKTFIREDHAELSHAPFLRTKRQVWVKYERLDHKPFTYLIIAENRAATDKEVTFRVFLAPKFDDFGNTLELNEQRRLMIELDKFHKKLAPGSNSFHRHSGQSSVTIPRRGHSFTALRSQNFQPTVDYCNCGWPQHLLIPRGTPTGMDFVLFVMCTDYAKDTQNIESRTPSCSEAVSYCGAKDLKYPDTKPMGYPFDRVIRFRTLGEFLTLNMAVTDIKIKFLGSSQNFMKETKAVTYETENTY